MNQKDYKKIAEIIREELTNDITSNGRKFTKGVDWDLLDEMIRKVVFRLADYFEEEEIESFLAEKGDIPKDTLVYCEQRTKKREFNRKQFLKDCGVDE